MTHEIRAVEAEDWPKVKELRLAALKDPVAHLAFLESYDDAAARSDQFWQDRAAGSRGSVIARSFIAEAADGEWLGNVTVLIEPAGVEGVFGDVPEVSQTHLVGVFVRPEQRGSGLTDELFRAGVEWSWSVTEPRIERVRLFVHEENVRAEAFYRKFGFAHTGEHVPSPDGKAKELEMALPRT